MRSPLDNLHKLIVLSQDPEAKYSPFGENATLVTREVCPVRVLMSSQFNTLQRQIVLSLDPDAKYYPFGENATLIFESKWS